MPRRSRDGAQPAGFRAPVFVGKPSFWGNPFDRAGISPSRSVILYRAWMAGELTLYILRCAHFSHAEALALDRWRVRAMSRLGELRDAALNCDCRSPHCHRIALAALAGALSEARQALGRVHHA